MKLTDRFQWPLWHFPVALSLSILLTPIVNADMRLVSLSGKFIVIGYVLFAGFYLKGRIKSGRRIDWVACLFCVLFMPVIAWLMIGVLGKLYDFTTQA
jgi:uncharacterized membrane protein YgdD (TMEM256/DUF423 family)